MILAKSIFLERDSIFCKDTLEDRSDRHGLLLLGPLMVLEQHFVKSWRESDLMLRWCLGQSQRWRQLRNYARLLTLRFRPALSKQISLTQRGPRKRMSSSSMRISRRSWKILILQYWLTMLEWCILDFFQLKVPKIPSGRILLMSMLCISQWWTLISRTSFSRDSVTQRVKCAQLLSMSQVKLATLTALLELQHIAQPKDLCISFLKPSHLSYLEN
jgi:hypothetical protein